MSRKAKTNGSTALATVATAPSALQITRADANASIKARALELYHEARTQRDERIRSRVRSCRPHRPHRPRGLAAYPGAARRDRGAAATANATRGEPKVTKFVEQLSTMVRAVSAHLATERALESFAPIQQSDYVGWNRSGVGRKGQDDALLAGYEIVNDPLGAQNAVPTAEVCLHTDIEPYEDEPSRGACLDCGKVELRGSPAGGRLGGRRAD